VASSVPDALRVGDRGEFDLVVVGVPPFGGLAVLDDVRVAFPSSVVLALVEDPDPVFSGQVRGLGAQEVLSRSGLTPADFAAAVTRLVETSNPRSEIAARVAHVEGLLAAVSEGILVQSATGRVVLANERALEMLQVPREVLISADLTAAGIEFRSAAGRLLERDQLPDAVARRTRRPVPPVLLQVRRGDGELRWFEATTSPLVHADQEVPYAVVTAIRDMTETQAAQETMVSAERRERLLLEYAGEGYLLLDAHGVVTESSELVERFWPQQLVGRELRELVVDDDRADLALLLDDVTARRVSPLRAEARVVDARGEIRWVELTFANRLDEPSLIGIVVNLRDITSRKLAEESATRLSAILESTEDAIFSETLDGVITSWNSAAERLYGYAAPEAVGGSSLIIVPADRLNGVLDVRSRVLKGNRVELAETVRRRKDGSTVAVSLMVTPLVDSAGNLIGSSTTSRLPAARRDEGGEPSRAQDHFRLGFEHGAIGMAMVDGSDHFTLVNSALCRLLGREEDELLGHALAEFLHTGDLEARRGAAPSPADAGRFQGERHFVRPDGTIVTALVEMSSIRGDDGTPYHFCQVQDVTGWKRSEAALGHHALHDPLTGLANREMLSARLDLLIARNRHDETTSAVLAIDLDRFKVVNDGLGHAASDRLLTDVARRLVEGSRPQDLVARIAGDEFVVLCDRIVDADEADAVAERAVRLFDEPFVAAGQPVYLTVSCGVAVVDGASSVDDALRSADAAMHRAKDRGRDHVEHFDEQMREEVARRFDLEREIRFALERDELRVFYQPILTVGSAELVGVEALCRWDHPTRGLLRSDEFIPIAEQTGLISAIGTHVLELALRQIVRWREELPGCEKLWVSVNMSSRQLLITNPVTMCLWALAATGAPADALVIELTETAVMKEIDMSISRLEDLRAVGIKIAIDDFGTGQSSLSYLSRLPVDLLKIDRSFIDSIGTPDSAAIVETIVSLARTLGLELCAEGVESHDQRAALYELGCQYGQGFLWSRPLGAAEFGQWVTGTFAAAATAASPS
jgi:diguanylate cyclase (GGDEF)-like protein/PAS domain S-box-containing protein